MLRRAHRCARASTCCASRCEERFAMALTSPSFNAPATAATTRRCCPTTSPAAARLSRSTTRARRHQGARSCSRRWRWAPSRSTPGLRYDDYRFLVDGRQLQPRVGVAYRRARRDRRAARVSYNRNYQTPPNENLLLSNSRGRQPARPRQRARGARRRLSADPARTAGRLRSRAPARARPARHARVLGLPQGLARSAGQQQLLRHRHHLSDDAAADRRDRRRGAARIAAAARLSRAR